MEFVERFLKIFKRKKEEKPKTEIIPEGYVKCTRCGGIVRRDKATVSLPEEVWVCDECYFGRAE